MKKDISIIFICLILGLFFSKAIFNSYNSKEILKASLNQEKIYLIQIGKFKNKKEMQLELESIDNYIYELKNKIYYAYAGITIRNLQKLENYFKKQGFAVYPKQINCNNLKFLDELNNYDNLLTNTNDDKTISDIQNQIINKYKEIVDVKRNTKK